MPEKLEAILKEVFIREGDCLFNTKAFHAGQAVYIALKR